MRPHINNLDALRLLGALLVLVNHSLILVGGRPLGLLGQSMSTVGVMLFFSISGYLVARSWQNDPNAGRFLLRRARRIMPALAFVVLGSVLVIGPFFTPLPLAEYFSHPHTLRYLGNVVFYSSYALPLVFAMHPVPHAVNGSLWTLPVEVTLYAIAPFVVLTAARSKWAMLAVTVAAIALPMYYYLYQPPLFTIAGTEFWTASMLAPFFVVGAAFAALRLERWLHWGFGLGLILAFEYLSGPLAVWRQALLTVVLPYSALSLGLIATPFLSRVGRYGDFSYGLYLWGYPVQQVVVALGGAAMGGWGNLAWALPITAAFAGLSFHLVEKPAMRRGSASPSLAKA